MKVSTEYQEAMVQHNAALALGRECEYDCCSVCRALVLTHDDTRVSYDVMISGNRHVPSEAQHDCAPFLAKQKAYDDEVEAIKARFERLACADCGGRLDAHEISGDIDGKPIAWCNDRPDDAEDGDDR